jgi:Holliday junction resolvasome RuvABC endonuclease subunit
MVNYCDPELIVYEQAHHRGGAATEVCVGMSTRVMEVAAQNDIEYSSCHTATLKKWATGKGNADKKAMIKRAYEFVDEVIDDNHADAILLGIMASCDIG